MHSLGTQRETAGDWRFPWGYLNSWMAYWAYFMETSSHVIWDDPFLMENLFFGKNGDNVLPIPNLMEHPLCFWDDLGVQQNVT